MKKAARFSKSELLEFKNRGFLTVGRLKKFIDDTQLSDDALVLVERITDKYYDNYWAVYCKLNKEAADMLLHNKRIDSGFYKKDINKTLGKTMQKDKFTDDEIKACCTEYRPASTVVLYADDPDGDDFLFIDLNY